MDDGGYAVEQVASAANQQPLAVHEHRHLALVQPAWQLLERARLACAALADQQQDVLLVGPSETMAQEIEEVVPAEEDRTALAQGCAGHVRVAQFPQVAALPYRGHHASQSRALAGALPVVERDLEIDPEALSCQGLDLELRDMRFAWGKS